MTGLLLQQGRVPGILVQLGSRGMELIQPCGRSDVGPAPLHLERGNMVAGHSRDICGRSDNNNDQDLRMLAQYCCSKSAFYTLTMTLILFEADNVTVSKGE